MSIAGGTPNAIAHARAVGATALQLFLKNNTQWRGKPIAPAQAEHFRADLADAGLLAPPVAHACYLINLASPDPVVGRRSVAAMIDELRRAELLGMPGVIVHPGSHMGRGEVEGLRLIAERIRRILDATDGLAGAIYLETTAGQGTSLGWRFEHLAAILAAVDHPARLGVCLDTCHVFAAGYDIRTPENVKLVLRDFERIIGLGRLRAIHVNDSKQSLGSRVDRHEHIGQGAIGEAGFAALLRDRRLRRIPFILETPKDRDLTLDRMNLATLRRLAGQKGRAR
jgi:deoxyribonuclease-4